MSIESELDHLMTDCKEDGIHIQDYLENKQRLRGSKHDPRYTHDMIGKIIY